MSFGPYSRAGLALVFVPLYAGPVLAGLSNHGWATVPIFALLFLVFIAATRRPDLHQLDGWVSLAIMALVQVALSVGAISVGSLASAFIDMSPLPLWFPLALTAVAAGYGAWRYSDTAEMDVFLDSVIEKLEAFEHDDSADLPAYHPTPSRKVQSALDDLIDAVQSLPDDVRVGEIDPLVQRYEMRADIDGFDPLYDAAGEVGGREDRRIDLALLRFVASPRIQRQLVARGEGALTPMLLLNAEDRAVRAEAQARLTDLLDAGTPMSQMPDPVWLRDLDETYPDEGFADLARKLDRTR
ncbi:MAG TPA: hypothetical protein DEO85_04090 [Maritimibacter sp.]|nr:hypothetical protein [Maritimibacter sp.]